MLYAIRCPQTWAVTRISVWIFIFKIGWDIAIRNFNFVCCLACIQRHEHELCSLKIWAQSTQYLPRYGILKLAWWCRLHTTAWRMNTLPFIFSRFHKNPSHGQRKLQSHSPIVSDDSLYHLEPFASGLTAEKPRIRLRTMRATAQEVLTASSRQGNSSIYQKSLTGKLLDRFPRYFNHT